MRTEPITLHAWLARATQAQRAELATLAKSTTPYLYQLATGRRNASAEKAAAIEEATKALHGQHPELPPVLRTSSCQACSACPYAQQCHGGAQ